MSQLLLQPVRVDAGGDEEGLLVLVDDQLVGVLVRLSVQHASLAGRWFLEASFGPTLEASPAPTFSDLGAAREWIDRRARRRRNPG